MKNMNLREQLFVICTIMIGIIIISLGIILPNRLIPIYETNVYNYLRQPLSFLQSEDDINTKSINTKVAYIYISSTDTINISDNLNEVIDIENINKLLSKLDFTKESGKFKYKRHEYYYVTEIFNNKIRIAITNDSYIEEMKKSIIEISKYIAYHDSTPIGVISVKDEGDGVYYIGCLCVIPEFQRKGIGHQLIEFMKTQYNDWKKIELITPIDKEKNVKFYTEKCGFMIDNEEMDRSVKVYHFSMHRNQN